MARPKSNTPAYCHHKRSGRAYVTVNGQQHTLPGTHGSEESRTAYDLLIAEWLGSGRTLAGKSATGPTVSVIVAEFWRHAQAHYRHADGSPTSEIESFRQALRVLRKLYGNIPAIEFGPKKLKALVKYVTTERQERDDATGQTITVPGWCRTYTNRQVKRIQYAFRWAASEELVPVTIAQALGTVAGIRQGAEGTRESEPVGPVADDVVDATLSFLPPPVPEVKAGEWVTTLRERLA